MSAETTLGRFTAECRGILEKDDTPAGRERIRILLEGLLRDEAFVQKYCVEPKPALYRLYTDPGLGFEVLAHINEKPRVSPPHDHGASWAIYGQATLHTEITEWARTDDGAEPGRAALKPLKTYRLQAGHAATFEDGMIHSIDYPARSCFVRVTGTNLDQIRRVMFDLAAGTVTQMTPQRAT